MPDPLPSWLSRNWIVGTCSKRFMRLKPCKGWWVTCENLSSELAFSYWKIRISQGFHLGISLCLQQNINFVFCTFSMSLNSFLKYFPTPLEISFSGFLSNSSEFYYTFSPSLYWQEALLPFGKHWAFTFFFPIPFSKGFCKSYKKQVSSASTYIQVSAVFKG